MTPQDNGRLTSLDQCRGFTVAAMLAVNFMGSCAATPALLRHHNTWCSLADTVMPQFFFAAGMALRLVMERETARQGRAAALRRGVRRGLLLMLIGWVFYMPGRRYGSWEGLTAAFPWPLVRDVFLTNAFQALTHIGATTLWVLPVMSLGWRVRVVHALASAALHAWISHVFWYRTLHEWHVIDGGPLGFLTWTLPMTAGSLAWDALRGGKSGGIRRLAAWGGAAMAMGYALSCLTQGGVVAAPPFVAPWHEPDMWTMSQRAGSVSYLMFGAGFAAAVQAAFAVWSDRRGGRLRLFADLGENAMAAYLIHMVVLVCLEHVMPRDAPLWWVLAASAAGFLMTWGAVRWCTARGVVLRV